MAYVISENLAGGQPISATSTTAKHTVMQTTKAIDSSYGTGEFIYAKASLALLAGDVVMVKYADGRAKLISDSTAKASLGIVAVAQVAFAADEFGWLMRSGVGIARCKPGVETSVALYVNASVGTLGASTLSNMVGNIVAVTSVTTTVGAITVNMTFPYIVRAASLLAI